MVRRTTHGSDLELAVGESLVPMPTDSPAPKSPKPDKKPDDVFSFSLGGESEDDSDEDDHSVNLGADIVLDKPASASGKKSSSSQRLVAQAGSDSDVRLVPEGDKDIIPLRGDSDVKIAGDGTPKSGPKSSKGGSSGPKSPKSGKLKVDTPQPEPDSGVRLVPMDSDSDVRIGLSDEHVSLADHPGKSATDSDIRLEGYVAPADGGEGSFTDEINLDDELEKEEAREREQTKGRKQKPQPTPTEESPFDLSSSDLDLRPISDEELQLKDDSSSDFELTPAAEQSPLDSSSDSYSLDMPDEDSIRLADEPPDNLTAPLSGINLENPADGGISLEQPDSGTEEEFELTLAPEEDSPGGKPSTPRPGGASLVEEESDSSEFELSLDGEAATSPDSDSEFELTLDDTSGLSASDDESTDSSQEKDIFETDFDVPALDEESGSEAVAVGDVDTDLASSDFDLDISEESAAVEEDSGSEVVAVDEETVTFPPKKRGKKKPVADDDESGEFADLDEEEDDIVVEEEGEVQTVVVQQAPWGVLPVAVLLPCVIVMAMLGIMGFELVQTQQGYKPGFLTKAIGGIFGK